MMMSKRILTGITPSGTPHLGNYIGAIRPAIARQYEAESLFFIADFHSLVKLWDAKKRQQYIYEIAAAWLACGVDSDRVILYRQTEVPEILALHWILTTVAAKGLLNRAHAYKDLVAKNLQGGQDADEGITMGLFNYPILMAADILAFNPHGVPVGKDQIQHIEIARDLAQRFNHLYGPIFTLPEALVEEDSQTIPGLDGRKMSKSYGNTIPLFEEPKRLRKLIMKIVTNSQAPEEPKSTEGCTLFQLYQQFAKPVEVAEIAKRYQAGIGWGEMKQILYEKIEVELAEPRQRYQELLANKDRIDGILTNGAAKARAIAQPLLAEVYQLVGL